MIINQSFTPCLKSSQSVQSTEKWILTELNFFELEDDQLFLHTTILAVWFYGAVLLHVFQVVELELPLELSLQTSPL